ncbi:MAG: hypothetical protein QTN59_13870 [Candidatus Electrothrix communis]|nr:MAG: hypothetical protein QTN59_13870 [Candidatus Electrothrix communis]
MKYYLTGCMILLSVTLLSAEDGYANWRDKISLHGFGGWLYGQTDNENVHFLGGWDSEGNGDYFVFSLNARADLTDSLTVYLQPAFEEINGKRAATVDYAFAEWYLSDLFAIRAGRIKAPLMLMNEIHDVGTVRPFLLHPVGVYSDKTAENFQGIGLTGVYSPDIEMDWLFSYDIYGGVTDLSENDTGNGVIRYTIDELLGVRFLIHSPLEGLRFGVSGYTGQQGYNETYRGEITQHPTGDVYVVAGSIEYLSDQWELRSEYLLSLQDQTLYYSGEVKESEWTTYYAEAAYMLTRHWQVAVRYEVLDYPDYPSIVEKDLPADHPFKESKELTLGLNYWMHSHLVVKCAAVFIQGNNNVRPHDVWESETKEYQGDITLNEETIMTMVGVQFSF